MGYNRQGLSVATPFLEESKKMNKLENEHPREVKLQGKTVTSKWDRQVDAEKPQLYPRGDPGAEGSVGTSPRLGDF